MRHSQVAACLAFALLCGLPCALGALERPMVQVRFAITEPVYCEQLESHEKNALERSVEKLIVSRLSEELPFLRYSSDQSSRFIVYVTLGRAEASETSAHDVYFYFSLAASNEAQASAKWEFRSRSTWDDGIGNPILFHKEIAASLSPNRFNSLVHDFLERIPVAQEGETVRLPEYPIAWVLPFKQGDLCIASKSRVRLTTEIETSFNPREARDYWAEITIYVRPKKKEHQDRI